MNNETRTGLIKLQEVLYKKSLLEKEISDAPKTLMTNIEILNKLKKAYVQVLSRIVQVGNKNE